jgi:hypothetical protein
MGIILRTQKMAAGHAAAAFHKHFTQAIAPGDSPDESQTGINVRIFPGPLARQTRGADRYQHLG